MCNNRIPSALPCLVAISTPSDNVDTIAGLCDLIGNSASDETASNGNKKIVLALQIENRINFDCAALTPRKPEIIYYHIALTSFPVSQHLNWD